MVMLRGFIAMEDLLFSMLRTVKEGRKLVERCKLASSYISGGLHGPITPDVDERLPVLAQVLAAGLWL